MYSFTQQQHYGTFLHAKTNEFAAIVDSDGQERNVNVCITILQTSLL